MEGTGAEREKCGGDGQAAGQPGARLGHLNRSSNAERALAARCGLGLALDRRARLEQRAACCARPSGETRAGIGLLALEAAPGIEADALGAGVQIGAAAGAARVRPSTPSPR